MEMTIVNSFKPILEQFWNSFYHSGYDPHKVKEKGSNPLPKSLDTGELPPQNKKETRLITMRSKPIYVEFVLL